MSTPEYDLPPLYPDETDALIREAEAMLQVINTPSLCRRTAEFIVRSLKLCDKGEVAFFGSFLVPPPNEP